MNKNNKKWFILASMFLISILFIPFTFSKYTKSVNKKLTIDIRKPHYTVKFNANGGTGIMEDMDFTYGTAQNLTVNSFERDNCTFDRWNTKNDGTGTDYTDGKEVNNLNSTDGYVVNLYAIWKCNIYFQLPSDWYGTDVYTFLYNSTKSSYDYNYPLSSDKAQQVDSSKKIYLFVIEAGENPFYDHVIFNYLDVRKTVNLTLDKNNIGQVFVPELYLHGSTSSNTVRVIRKGSSTKPNYIYMFNKSTGVENASWPGVEMTGEVSDDSKSIIIDKNSYDVMIFNNGKGTNQTKDLDVPNYQDLTYQITGQKQQSISRLFYFGSWHNYDTWVNSEYNTWNESDNKAFKNAKNALSYD